MIVENEINDGLLQEQERKIEDDQIKRAENTKILEEKKNQDENPNNKTLKKGSKNSRKKETKKDDLALNPDNKDGDLTDK